MSLAERLAAPPVVPDRCKTCAALREVSAEDREAFQAEVDAGRPGSELARLLVDALRDDYDSHTTVSETAMRTHLRNKHVAR